MRISAISPPQRRRCTQARATARDLHNRAAEAMAFESLGMVLVMCGRFDEAKPVLLEALAIAQAVGRRRFEAIVSNSLARALWHEGAADDARQHAREAWRFSLEVGPRFSGPIALAGVALTAATFDERARALAEGERLLAQGCIAHCHLDFYGDAIDLALTADDWSEAERYADALEAFMRREPLPWSDFLVARGRALAAAGRGRGERAALEACRRDAIAFQFMRAVPALDAPFGSNPKGRERFGHLIWQMRALLALAIVSLLLRAPTLNRAQIAPRRMHESKPDRLLGGAQGKSVE